MLWHYQVQTCLTLLSIVRGVTSLGLLLEYGNGFASAVVLAFEEFGEIGKDLIVIFPGQTGLQAGGRTGRPANLT
ncbi:MAG: hypothetical protein N3G20_03220 [Verrucomicrobiae bacterium]|nr:hypothetical protein [Verrucomicrobiae bacterium]